jgi:hypothetical protein
MGQHVTDGAAEQMDRRGLPIDGKVHRLVEVGETDRTGNEGHDNSDLGSTPDRKSLSNTPDMKKTHSAPELVRSGHRCDRSVAHS